jgi:predicted aminopeptidase
MKAIRLLLRVIEWGCMLLFLLSAIFHQLVSYGIDQGIGQMNIVMHARPVQEVMNDPQVNDTIKQKLQLIEEIKKFAIDSLGLTASKNYSTFYDQHGKPILWVLTGAEKFRLRAVEWKFPVVGRVSYKGFFNFEKGKKAQQQLISKGYDTEYSNTSAWSTLGWFRDPVLSNFLYRSEGQIAELIIHEMTHATLYVKSSVDFNENFASAIGETGAEQFLESKYGDTSSVLADYRNRNEDYNRFASHMIHGTQQLDSLYHTFNDQQSDEIKNASKQNMINQIVSSLDTNSFHNKKRYHQLYDEQHLPNNAYLLGFTRYDLQKDEMKKELKEKYKNNIRQYIQSLKDKYK